RVHASEGFPEPRFTIFHNDTKVVGNERTYTICQVKWDDAGTYKCFAKNELGNDAAFAIFAVEEMQEQVATMLPTRSSANTNIIPTSINLTTSRSEDVKSGTTEWYIIVITLVSGIVIGILLSNIVSYSRRKLFTQLERTQEVQKTTADSTYQELDLKKMNQEDNYQSLSGNAERNDAVNNNESNYTELNKVKDIESNYQSLT
ncbi:uncharacterized protein LOC114536563, partial [Dendronephthya gigantea]|uniref:uncharacterized protein LOC114536563 n=1 Tax=Dendronephthya gigantea TaxID=151771 RepID=UPI00106B3E44